MEPLVGKIPLEGLLRPSTASSIISSRLDIVLPLDTDEFGRESEVEAAQLSLKVTPLNIGARDVRTLMDTTGPNRPERCTAFVGREFARYNIHVAVLSETRQAGRGQTAEVGSSFTFFWSRCGEGERRIAGVGFAAKSNLVNQLSTNCQAYPAVSTTV